MMFTQKDLMLFQMKLRPAITRYTINFINGKTHQNLLLFLSATMLLLVSAASSTALPPKRHRFSTQIFPEEPGFVKKREKLTHLCFYFHDIVSGNHPTAVTIVGHPGVAVNSSSFGQVVMIDDRLTLGPEPSSRLVGLAQGVYASASQEELGFLMVLNLAFVEGKYKGSSLSVLGRNAVFAGVREMPVVGGSGLFRLARGYVQAKTHSFDLETGDAVVEYNVYVFHY